MIRLFLDEDVPEAVAAALRLRGYDVLTTRQAGRKGLTDAQQLDYGHSQGSSSSNQQKNYLLYISGQIGEDKGMDERDVEKIEEVFKRHIGILSEDFQHKLDIVAEGHQMLSEKLDRVEDQLNHRIDGVEQRIDAVDQKVARVEQRIDEVDVKLSNKIDAVAADLAAHRADTEIHRTRYQVREDTDS